MCARGARVVVGDYGDGVHGEAFVCVRETETETETERLMAGDYGDGVHGPVCVCERERERESDAWSRCLW